MASSHDERSVDVLRRRAESAIDEGRGRLVVEPLLEAILERAGEDDPARPFAHRHLAELLLERDPWAAALHLRKVLAKQGNDDVAHSLMALAQALLGNYRAAAAAYLRALRVAPRNPWYRHNLGHLLDVALDDPHAALTHLELALEQVDATEHEIAASAAHCMARVGRLAEAQKLAQRAVDAAPENEEHETLLRWVKRGAPADQPVHHIREPRHRRTATLDAVAQLFELHMHREDCGDHAVECAHRFWADYLAMRAPRIKKPAIFAAAVQYALMQIHRIGIFQDDVGEIYGVSPASISKRYRDMHRVLELTDQDPRYR